MIEPRPSDVRITVVNDTPEFLAKPFNLDVLEELVARLLGREITPPRLMARPPDSLRATS